MDYCCAFWLLIRQTKAQGTNFNWSNVVAPDWKNLHPWIVVYAWSLPPSIIYRECRKCSQLIIFWLLIFLRGISPYISCSIIRLVFEINMKGELSGFKHASEGCVSWPWAARRISSSCCIVSRVCVKGLASFVRMARLIKDISPGVM